MAEVWPDEGLDYLLGIFPKNGSNLATTYLGLWTATGTASTVPATSAVLSTQTGITECTYTGYARQSIAAASWSAPGAQTINAVATRRVTGPQVTFPAATVAYATAIHGFFLATALTAGIAIFIANFDDLTDIPNVATTDTIKVTPTLAFAN